MQQSIGNSSKKFYLCFVFIGLFCLYSNVTNAASPLDINVATAEQLAAVMTGVGESKAKAIIEYREQHGAFTSLDDLIFVKGIGPSLLEKNREMLSIGAGEPYQSEETALSVN